MHSRADDYHLGFVVKGEVVTEGFDNRVATPGSQGRQKQNATQVRIADFGKAATPAHRRAGLTLARGQAAGKERQSPISANRAEAVVSPIPLMEVRSSC